MLELVVYKSQRNQLHELQVSPNLRKIQDIHRLDYIMAKFFIFSLFIQFLEDCPQELIRGFPLAYSRLGNRPCRLDKYAKLPASIK